MQKEIKDLKKRFRMLDKKVRVEEKDNQVEFQNIYKISRQTHRLKTHLELIKHKKTHTLSSQSLLAQAEDNPKKEEMKVDEHNYIKIKR